MANVRFWDGSVLTVEPVDRAIGERIPYRITVEQDGRTLYTSEGELSGPSFRVDRDGRLGMGDALSFLWSWIDQDSGASDDLFPDSLRDWAVGNADEIYMAMYDLDGWGV